MADLNKVFLMGRLTFDPELRWTTNGNAVADLRLATSRSWTGKDGERREDTLYIDVTVWNRQAETCCQYLKKGRAIHVEGYLKSESWEDKTTGEKRSKIKVEADRVQFLDSREAGASPAGAESDSGPPQAREVPPPRRSGSTAPDARGPANGAPRSAYPPQGNPAPRRPTPPPVESEGDDEDIPF